MPLMPLTETPKIVEGDLIHDHPARGIIMNAQTPQAFSFPEIFAAYELAHREGFKATDDAMIWDRYKGVLFHGLRENARTAKSLLRKISWQVYPHWNRTLSKCLLVLA